MQAATTYPHIVKENGEPAHLEKHPRLRVAMLAMDYIARALSPDEMVRHYPHLNLAEVHSAMAYYFDHQQEIDDEIAAELKQVDEDIRTKPRSPIYFKLKAKGLIN